MRRVEGIWGVDRGRLGSRAFGGPRWSRVEVQGRRVVSGPFAIDSSRQQENMLDCAGTLIAAVASFLLGWKAKNVHLQLDVENQPDSVWVRLLRVVTG